MPPPPKSQTVLLVGQKAVGRPVAPGAEAELLAVVAALAVFVVV